jgi:cytochrome c nitrite reductase small subunit
MGIALAILVGGIVGLGVFTFGYAEGWSYFSSDPRACVNCHIMRPEYDTWQKSSHHAAARCVDCHLPHSLFAKLIAKGENGYHHSLAFTLGGFHEPIRIKAKNARILQANCVACHAALVAEIAHGRQLAGRSAIGCVHCHHGVGHGP